MRCLSPLFLLLGCAPDGQAPDDSTMVPSYVDLYDVDTDRDGFSDAEEMDRSSDPKDCTSVPGKRSWPNCLAEALDEPAPDTGWSLKDVSPNWAFTDQYGDEQQFWRFRGTVLVLEVWPFW